MTGEVTAKAVEEQIRPSTKLVLVLHASNVCGTILPIEEIGAVCRKHGVFFAVDTAPVSYTHLDVYKRQRYWCRFLCRHSGGQTTLPWLWSPGVTGAARAARK